LSKKHLIEKLQKSIWNAKTPAIILSMTLMAASVFSGIWPAFALPGSISSSSVTVTDVSQMSTPRRLVIVADDGSGNFSTIPQAILSLAQANQVTIFIKSGTYTITSPVDLPSNLWIIGDPNAVPLIKNGGTFPSDPGKGRGVFEVRGSSSAPKQNVQIRNIRFQGSGSWDGGDFIRADYATQLVFENIQAYNTGRHMIRCDHCVDTTITNLFGDTANSNMLRLLNSTNVLVEKSQFKNAGGWSDEGGTILASGVG
jgi:hypothetical protein